MSANVDRHISQGGSAASRQPFALAPLIRNLEAFGLASDNAKARLRALGGRVLSYGAGRDIVRDGEASDDVRVLVEGVACRHKALNETRQAIIGFLLPGDMDQPDWVFDHLGHGIASITDCAVVTLPRSGLDQATQEYPELARALLRAARIGETVLLRWLANVGQLPADKRTAHLLCELRFRFAAVGMGSDDEFDSPFKQEHLANALGISVVHVNRVLGRLRQSGLIQINGRKIYFPAPEKADAFAGFDPAYLWVPTNAAKP